MRKKVHKLSENELLSELDSASHLPPPVFNVSKPSKPYAVKPNDVEEFLIVHSLIPKDMREVELVLCSRLREFYDQHLGFVHVVKKNDVQLGRLLSKSGIFHVRRRLFGKLHYFYVVNKHNRLGQFFKTMSEGDNEKRQRQAAFRIERKKWEHLPQFKKSAG